MLKKYNSSEDGFTLIELLIVVLIIGILAAVAIPVYIGIQTNARHSAVKADANSTVKQVQVALTEGALSIPSTASSTGISGYSDTAARSDGVTVVTTPLGNGDFQVQATGKDGYTYTYSSVTGQFTEGSASVGFGGGNQANVAPTITSAVPTSTAVVNNAYSYTVVASGTPSATFTATGLPTGLGINATTGVISGTPTAAGTFNYTITATNGTSPDATQSGTITVTNVLYTLNAEANDPNASMWGLYNNSGAVSAYSTGQAHSPTRSVYLPANAYARILFSTPLPANKSYTVTFWVFNVSGQGQGMNFSSGSTYYGNSTAVGAWQQVTATYTPTTPTTYLNFGSYYGGSAYIDDVTITQNN